MTTADLLTPLDGASPCGEDLSFSTEFDQIAELRREDDPTLDQGEWVTSLKVADWPGVVGMCQSLLAGRTKDLRLAMWLTEALTLTRGFEGLHEGLSLCHALCDRYWDDVHPLPEDGDMDQRVGNMAWLLQRLVHLVPTRPVTQGRQGGAYSLQDLAQARALHALQERSPEDAARLGGERPTLDQVQRALRETPREHLRHQCEQARASHTALLRWQALVDERLGDNGPTFVSAKEALAQAADELERVARELGALDNDVAASDGSALSGSDEALPVGAGPAPQVTRGPLASRQQALQQLREVAQFFRRTEPHSPVAYLADKAVKWAEMPLHEWLRQVIKDQGSMAHLDELLGVEPDAPSVHG